MRDYYCSIDYNITPKSRESQNTGIKILFGLEYNKLLNVIRDGMILTDEKFIEYYKGNSDIYHEMCTCCNKYNTHRTYGATYTLTGFQMLMDMCYPNV